MARTTQTTVKTPKSTAIKTATKAATQTISKAAARPAKKTAGQVVRKISKVALKVAPQETTVAPQKASAKETLVASHLKTPDSEKTGKSKVKLKSAVKEVKPLKQKLVRDSFTFPQSEYLVLVGMKKRLLAAGVDAKKGELVRAGISVLASLDDKALVKALAAVEKLKAGRPAK